MSEKDKTNIQRKLLQSINDIPVIDTHVHIGSEGISLISLPRNCSLIGLSTPNSAMGTLSGI